MSDERISVDAIGRAPVERPPAEPRRPGENPLTGKDEKLNQHLGRIGGFVGGGPEKAGNIAYIVIVAAFLVLIAAAVGSAVADSDKVATVLDKLVTGCISLITGAMGYLFGASKDTK